MRSKEEQQIRNPFYLLNKDNNPVWRETFMEGIEALKGGKYLDCIQLMTTIIDTEQVADEERSLAFHLRYLAHGRLFRFAVDKDKKASYGISMMEDEMSQKFYAALAEPYHLASCEKPVVTQDNDCIARHEGLKKNRPTKAELREKEKIRKQEALIKKAKACNKNKDFKAAAKAWQDVLDAGIVDYTAYKGRFSALLSLSQNEPDEPLSGAKQINSPSHDLLQFCKIMIENLSKNVASPERDELLYYAHTQSGELSFFLYPTFESNDLALQHYATARQYMPSRLGEETINQRRLLLIAYSKMKYYARKVSVTSVEEIACVHETMIQHSKNLYEQFASFFESYPQEEIELVDRVCDYLSFGEAAWNIGNQDIAEFWLQKVIDSESDLLLFEASYRLAGIYASNGDYQKAVEVYKQLISQHGDMKRLKNDKCDALAKAVFRLAICTEYAGDLANALGYFVQSAELRQNAPAVLGLTYILHSRLLDKQSIESSSIAYPVHCNQNGLTLFSSNVNNDYQTQYASLLREIDAYLENIDEPMVCSFMIAMKAVIHMKNKQLEKADACFSDAAARFPLTPLTDYYFKKVKILLHAKKDASALDKLRTLPLPAVTNQGESPRPGPG